MDKRNSGILFLLVTNNFPGNKYFNFVVMNTKFEIKYYFWGGVINKTSFWGMGGGGGVEQVNSVLELEVIL